MEMDETRRLNALEADVVAMKSDVAATKGDVASTRSDVHELRDDIKSLTGVIQSINNSIIKNEASKPPEFGKLMTMAVAGIVIFGGLVGGFNFLIDAKIGHQTRGAQAFVEEWTKEGRIYRLEDHFNETEAKVKKIELQLKRLSGWKPYIVSAKP